jgi:hypothetical protein
MALSVHPWNLVGINVFTLKIHLEFFELWSFTIKGAQNWFKCLHCISTKWQGSRKHFETEVRVHARGEFCIIFKYFSFKKKIAIPLEGFSSNLAQMFTSTWWCAEFMMLLCWLKVILCVCSIKFKISLN